MTDDTVTFVPCWCDYTVKYAVRIYGIKQDVDESGRKIGLTFGPAGGYGDSDNGEHTYVYCGDGTSGTNKNEKYKSCDNPNGCLHNLTWEEIAEKAKNSPDDFLPCLQNRCTQSVKFIITGPLAGNSYAGKMDDCDGASALDNSIADDYREWNAYDYYPLKGGWRDSNVRNTLTGVTNDAIVSHGGNLTEDESLFAMLPQVLKDNIVAKKVNSVIPGSSPTFYNGDLVTTYDKLWLFSTYEMYVESGYNSDINYIHDEDGELYQSQKYLDAVCTENPDLTTVNRFYDEDGSAKSSCSRSYWHLLYTSFTDKNCFSEKGHPDLKKANLYAHIALSPGFCIG